MNLGPISDAVDSAVDSVRDYYEGWYDKSAEVVKAIRDDGLGGLEKIGWIDDAIGETRRERRAKAAAKQAAADAKPDEFDLLVREAMFANASNDVSARAATFTTTPRGMQGPYKTVLDPSVPEVEYDDETEAALLSALA